jgi:hypothetical protein
MFGPQRSSQRRGAEGQTRSRRPLYLAQQTSVHTNGHDDQRLFCGSQRVLGQEGPLTATAALPPFIGRANQIHCIDKGREASSWLATVALQGLQGTRDGVARQPLLSRAVAPLGLGIQHVRRQLGRNLESLGAIQQPAGGQTTPSPPHVNT